MFTEETSFEMFKMLLWTLWCCYVTHLLLFFLDVCKKKDP